MAKLFTPPTVDEGPAGGGPLFSRYGMPRGISLLVTGTMVVEQRFPTVDQIAAADVAYIGGHIYQITDAAAQILIDAGYADCVEPFDGYIDTYEESY